MSETNAGSTKLLRIYMRDLDTYQDLAHETAMYPGKDDPDNLAATMYPVLKLNGEAGEVAELIGKAYRSQTHLDLEKLKLELGDVLWYVSEIARRHNIKLSEVAQSNLIKLAERAANNQIAVHE